VPVQGQRHVWVTMPTQLQQLTGENGIIQGSIGDPSSPFVNGQGEKLDIRLPQINQDFFSDTLAGSAPL
jgi:hypothetical protein